MRVSSSRTGPRVFAFVSLSSTVVFDVLQILKKKKKNPAACQNFTAFFHYFGRQMIQWIDQGFSYPQHILIITSLQFSAYKTVRVVSTSCTYEDEIKWCLKQSAQWLHINVLQIFILFLFYTTEYEYFYAEVAWHHPKFILNSNSNRREADHAFNIETATKEVIFLLLNEL